MPDDTDSTWPTAPYDDRGPADLADPTPTVCDEMASKAGVDEPGVEFHFYVDGDTGECVECIPTPAIGETAIMDAPSDPDIYEVVVEANDDLGPDGLPARIERAKEAHLMLATDAAGDDHETDDAHTPA